MQKVAIDSPKHLISLKTYLHINIYTDPTWILGKAYNGKPSFSRKKKNEETPVIFYARNIPNMFNYFTLQDETDETYENV